MNTLTWIRSAKKHFLIFASACVVSNIGFYLNYIMPKDLYFGIGLYSMLLWAINPLPLIYSLKGLLHDYRDHKDEDSRTIIGTKWIQLPGVLFFFYTVFYRCLHYGFSYRRCMKYSKISYFFQK